MTRHFLKTWPEPFQASWEDRKPYEVRRADRDFQRRDLLILQEWNPETQRYTGRAVQQVILHITGSQPPSPLPDGVCVLGVRLVARFMIQPARRAADAEGGGPSLVEGPLGPSVRTSVRDKGEAGLTARVSGIRGDENRARPPGNPAVDGQDAGPGPGPQHSRDHNVPETPIDEPGNHIAYRKPGRTIPETGPTSPDSRDDQAVPETTDPSGGGSS